MTKNNIDNFNKKAGGAIIKYGRDIKGKKIEVIPTGLMNLDQILGCGGLPKGRIVTVSGLQSVSKTTLSLCIIAKYQKEGIRCCFLDAEFSLNLSYAEALGVNTDDLLIIEPETGEQAFEAIESVLRDGLADFIVVDSVSALSVRAEMEAETGKPTMGAQARLISQGLRKLIGLLNKKKAILLFISQARMNIMGGQYDPYIESGGLALKYYTSISLWLSRDKAIMEGENLIGYMVKVKVKKNKVGLPGGQTTIQLIFGEGFSEEADVLSIALERGIIERKGNSYYCGDELLGKNKRAAQEFLASPSAIVDKIISEIQTN